MIEKFIMRIFTDERPTSWYAIDEVINMDGFLEGRLIDRNVIENAHTYIQSGEVTCIQGIENGRCMRCHNKDPRYLFTYHCAVCNGPCTYCRKCIQLGRISSCTTLLKWCGPQYPRTNDHTLELSGLSAAQQRASDELIESIRQKRSHLLHAVCGAGKTEILFQPVLYALQQQLRVCMATPRTDVVLELAPRLKRAFPKTFVQPLYGGAPVEHRFAPLIVATTHQLLRFEAAFDVMIVDEADAFPYTYDEMLQRAVNKAKTADAPICFVTATPSKKLLATCEKERWGYSFLPRRYHGYPLPVPRIATVWRLHAKLQKNKLPNKLYDWLKLRKEKQQPFLVFLPTIELTACVLPLVQQVIPRVEAVHAQDEQRKEKVLQLREGQLQGLVTSTILERGITITNVQVAVVCADDAIFDAGALIQISGRVGRHVQYASGDVVFFSEAITIAMDEAIAEIKRLNAVMT